MAGKTERLKNIFFRAGSLLIGAVILIQSGMRRENPVHFLFDILFPANTYQSEDYIGSFLQAGTSVAGQYLFPGADYLYAQNEKKTETVAEFSPTKAQLGHFDNENKNESERVLQEMTEKTTETESTLPAAAAPVGTVYPIASLLDYDFLINQFFIVDSSTSCDSSVIQPQALLNKDLTMDLSGEAPKVLIYHTHSQETFADSVPGDEYGTVVGLGNTLEDILENKYGIGVYHDKGTYDVIDGRLDRDEAYSVALPVVEQILADNPSIKVVIDLHRDGVDEDTRLVTQVNGEPTAKIMFFNGLCRGAVSGTNGYIQNPYLTDNLAFSLQLQLKAEEKYPDLMRRIYLRAYRFNMHVAPRTLLVECGAQTNTVEEVHNAMEPLADILYSVLSGT